MRNITRLTLVVAALVVTGTVAQAQTNNASITATATVLTPINVNGAQQLSFFNGHYGYWCYLPMVAFLTFNREPDQYLCAALLRAGNAPTQQGALPLLKRIVGRLQASTTWWRWPRTRSSSAWPSST